MPGQQLPNHLLGLPAIRALEIAVFDQGHGRVVRSANVIAGGVDILGQVENILGRTADLARARAGR